MLKSLLFICLTIKLASCRISNNYYPKCLSPVSRNSIPSDPRILQTKNGLVGGDCYLVPYVFPDDRIKMETVYAFLSIPYVEKITPKTRFSRPKPVKNWEGIIDGTVWPDKCMQLPINLTNPITIDTSEKEGISEDCLYLNIFVPGEAYTEAVLHNEATKRRPIMVVIHDGLISGSASQDEFEPSALAVKNDIIVVTFNFRIAAFGFLHVKGTSATGNQGFLDQYFALKWVYENANFFGGDQGRITLNGYGSILAGYHLIYPPSWNYFTNVILESASPLIKRLPLLSSEEATERALGVLERVGCYNPNDDYDNYEIVIQCARGVSPNLLMINAKEYFFTNVRHSLLSFFLSLTPFPMIKDNHLFKDSAENLFRKGKYKKCNILTGFTSQELGYIVHMGFLGKSPQDWIRNQHINETYFRHLLRDALIYYPRYPIRAPTNFATTVIDEYLPHKKSKNYKEIETNVNYFKALVRILTDWLVTCPAIELAEIYSKTNKAYVYSYEYHLSTSIYPNFLAAVNRDDLPVLFGEPISRKNRAVLGETPWTSALREYDSNERVFSIKFMSYWTNFIKFNNPSFTKEATETWLEFLHAHKHEKREHKHHSDKFNYMEFNGNKTTIRKGYKFPRCKFWHKKQNYENNNINTEHKKYENEEKVQEKGYIKEEYAEKPEVNIKEGNGYYNNDDDDDDEE